MTAIVGEHGPEFILPPSVLMIERLGWNEALHPRAGGKFAKKGTGSTGKDSAEGLSYNGRTGAGYGHKAGDNRVHALQGELNRLGFKDASGKALKLDGKLGPRTTAAIKRAQRALGLKADGVATPALLSKLKAAKGKGAPVKKVVTARKAVKPPVKKAAPVAPTGPRKRVRDSAAKQKSDYLASKKD